jgi:sarcosine oxidase
MAHAPPRALGQAPRSLHYDSIHMWDVAVVGLGGVGSFALRSLARRSPSLRIIGLERFHVGHDKGSSHGGTRIYRHAYFEHPNYVPLLKYSTGEFHALQREMKRPIIEQCGNLIIERRRKRRSAACSSTPVIDACLESAARHSIEVELIEDQCELSRRYPQFQFEEDHMGMIEPGGGFVRPEAAVQAAIDDAVGNGATIQQGVKVESIVEMDKSQGKSCVAIQTISSEGKKKLIEARKVVVAGGPWAGQLLPKWSKYLCVTKQVQAWINVAQLGTFCNNSNAEMHGPSAMPTWIREESNGNSEDQTTQPMLYGFPCDPQSEKPTWMKIALHGRHDPVDPDDMLSGSRDVSEAELDELRFAAVPFLRGITRNQRFIHAKTCLYTCSPDDDFLVGRPEGNQHVVAAAGLSGHGFKMTPALGQALADMAIGGKTDLPVDFLCPSRFEG